MTSPKLTTVVRKTAWTAMTEAAAGKVLVLCAVILITATVVLGIAVMPTSASNRSRLVVALVTLIGILITCGTIIAVRQNASRKGSASTLAPDIALPETEKQRLILENEELVIDAEKPPLSHDDLTKQLQQLRLVLHQAPRYSTPTYYLDKHLSIIDWNVAFALIFKPILRKLRRRHVNYLIAELANHDAVFDHARDFTEKVKKGQLPLVDIEPLVYFSEDYGTVEFEKVATQLTDAEANMKAWAVALFLKRIDWDMYARDLLEHLRDEKLWGTYAVSYDRVLSDFGLYRQLIDEVIRGVPPDAWHVLELGAGTGNATQVLLQRGYRVTAVENNPLMLEKMSAKRLVQTGRLSINMDSVEEFDFLGDGHFDAAVAVNVVYALDDPFGCFRRTAQALKPGGMFALSTTYSETNVDSLLAAIEAELRAKGTFNSKEEHYRRVVAINKYIESTIAKRYSREQYQAWLEQAGFEIAYNQLSYKDTVVVIHARKV